MAYIATFDGCAPVVMYTKSALDRLVAERGTPVHITEGLMMEPLVPFGDPEYVIPYEQWRDLVLPIQYHHPDDPYNGCLIDDTAGLNRALLASTDPIGTMRHVWTMVDSADDPDVMELTPGFAPFGVGYFVTKVSYDAVFVTSVTIQANT